MVAIFRGMKPMPQTEAMFFSVFEEVVGTRYLKAKTLGTRASSDDVFLDRDHAQYGFPAEVSKAVVGALERLGSTGPVEPGSLAHHVNGFLTGHPQLGTRIVEFDEEQHFNPYRRATLECLLPVLDARYISDYLNLCEDAELYNAMLKKHRLRVSVDSVPSSVENFRNLVEQYATPNNGYIEPKVGFEFNGGRIAQRAFYDTLRDVAHLASENTALRPALRFSKFELERGDTRIERMDRQVLRSLIERRLRQLA